MTFVDVWIWYSVFGAIVSSAVFVWAVRSRQFTELDRQRYIALRAGEQLEKEPVGRMPSLMDRYTWLVLLLLICGVAIAALWIGYRSA